MSLLPLPLLLTLLVGLFSTTSVLSQKNGPEAIITGVWPAAGSLAGGTQITLRGSGFLRAGTQGSTSVTIGGETCAEIAYYTTDNTIICTTPAAKGEGGQPLLMTLIGTGYGSYAQCSTCTFVYSLQLTPYLDVVQTTAVVAGGQLVYEGLMYANYYSQYNEWVGGVRCSMAPSADTALDLGNVGGGTGYDVGQSCTVSDQEAGRYAFTVNLLPTPDPVTLQQLTYPINGYGNATVNPHTYSVDADGKLYTVVQLPVITGLSSQQGATSGGQLLTISGTSFATSCADVTVTVGGSVATPISCDLDSIVVQTGANTDTNTRETLAAALGGYGSAGYAYGVGSTGLVWQSGLAVQGLIQPNAYYGEQSMVGMLIVPYTASYQFLVTSRDDASFSLSNSSVPQFQQTLVSFQAEHGGSNPYMLNANQQSAWVSLQAGTPYYFTALLNTFLFGIGVRIRNPNNTNPTASTPFLPTDSDNHKLYQSVPALLQISFSVAVQREVQTIYFTGAAGGSFQLTVGGPGGYAGVVPFPTASPNDVNTINAIAAIAWQASGCNYGSIGVVGFYTTAASTLASGVAWNVSFNCPSTSSTGALRPLFTIQNVGLNATGSSLSWRVTHTQAPSVPLQGALRAGFTAPGAATVWGHTQAFGTGDFLDAMQSAVDTAGVGSTLVQIKQIVFNPSDLYGDGVVYIVQVTSTLGDTSSYWSFDTSALTGTGKSTSIGVLQTASFDRFYNTIPGEWTALAADQNQIVVSVKGLRSVCGVGAGEANLQTWMVSNVPSVASCQYQASAALVPQLSAVSQTSAAAGSLLTITGSGFDTTATNNIISFQPQFTSYTTFPTATAIQSTATSLVFALPSLSGGQYRLSVQVTTKGSDDPTAAPVLITVQVLYNTPSPLVLTGSIAGGALLIVTGSGFHIPQLLAFAGNDSFVEIANYSSLGGDEVLIGGQECVLEDVSFTMLICRVPAPISQAGQTADITINSVHLGTYTYAQSATPQVTSITPSTVSAAVTSIITITGSGFVVPASYPSYFFGVDLDNPYNFSAVGHATTYDNTLFAEFAVHFNSRSCQVLSASPTQLTCQLTRSTPLSPQTTQQAAIPTVYVMGLGYAQAGENAVQVAFQVNTVSPSIGSLAGGQYITITGAGFIQQSTTVVTIDILSNKQLSDYPSMTTQSASTHAMRVMSMAEGSVPAAQRFFPLQVDHAAPHLKKNAAKSSDDALSAVMDAMHHRSHTQATKISANTRTWHTMSNFAWTGLSVPCAITSLSYGQIVCFTQGTDLLPSNFTGSGYSSLVGIVHVTINQIDTVCLTADPSKSCLYGFDVAHTPTITAVSPTSGPAGTVITIAGSLLNSPLSSVLIGYDACTNVAQTASQITCTVPANTAATVPVQVLFSSVGFAANTSLLTFTRLLSISSLSQPSGSYGGGTTLTLTGSGFSTVAKDNNLTIGGLPGIVVSSTSTQLVVTTPPALYAAQDTAATLWLTVAGYFYAAYTYPNVNSQSVYPVMGDENPAMLSSTSTSASFTYTTTLTPTLTAVTPQAGGQGTAITVTGTGFTAATTVEIGGVACTGITGQTSTSLSCTVQTSPAGTYPVNVIVPGLGLAYVASSNVAATSFTSSLSITGISPVSSSYGGGVNITVTGAGFGTLPAQTIVSVCNTNCTVVSATYNQIVCTTDALSTLDRIQKYGPPSVTIAQPYGGASLIGNLGNTPLSQLTNLNDDDPQTGVTASGYGAWVGMDMGANSLLALTQVRWYPPYGRAQATTAGGAFQSSMDGVNWNTLFTVSAYPNEGWNYVNLVNQTTGTTVASVTSAQRYFRYVAPNQVVLAMQEIEWQGYRVASVSSVVTNNDATQCPVAVTVVAQDPLESLQLDGAAYTNAFLQTPFSIGFSLSATPTINSISPNNGSSLGGTSITLTGTGFTASMANTQVALSGYPCTVSSVSATQVVCTTTARSFIGMSPTGTQISLIAGNAGRALLIQQGGVSGVPLVNPTLPLFRYLDRWSQINTWAYDEPPVAGDTVVIPQGQTILMDVSPHLFVLMVQGVLVWDNQDGLTLDSTYIWVNGGTFQIGTEQAPFTKNATITLHGDRYSTVELPYIGSKVLAVDGIGMGIFGTTYAPYARYGIDANGGARSDFYDNMNGVGVLDIHGLPRARVWTVVTPNTYVAGSRTIQTDEVVDFKAGEVLVFTDSSWNNNIEEVVVQSLSADGKTITLQSPLAYQHTSERYTIEGRDVDMRAKIAVLSRNIVIQGDSLSYAQQYGSHVMMMAGSIMRIENIETRQCGQGYNLGRYCLHFHMAGDVSKSYLKSNSIHDGYQRATTAHGVEYATIFNEVAYNIKGHNFFVEDGAERQNVFEGNLAINVQILTTMLQSDLMPAGFWTSSPANSWIHNVVEGTSNAGIWFELASNPGGPSADTNLCPAFMAIGQFYNNTFAHGSVGVQVYSQFLPMVDPCLGGAGGSTPANTQLDRTTVYRMGNGYNLKHMGPNIQISNSAMVECFSGIDWANLDRGYMGSRNQVVNSIVVGSAVAGNWLGSVNGFWLPQNEYVKVSGITFVNLPANAPAMISCKQCDAAAQMNQGGFTIWTSGLKFVNTPTVFGSVFPQKEIVFDRDGSLTGYVNGTLTANWAFNINPHCHVAANTFGLLVCDGTVRVRKLAIQYPLPQAIWSASLNVTSFDASGAFVGSALVPYHNQDFSGWLVPVVTGYTYSFNFTLGQQPIDFSQLVFRYAEQDIVSYSIMDAQHEFVLIRFPYQTYRWQFEVDYPGSPWVGLAVQAQYGNTLVAWNNYTSGNGASCIPTWNQPFGTGCNDAAHKVYTLVLNNQVNSSLGYNQAQALVQALECPYTGCVQAPAPVISSTYGLWSVDATWIAMNLSVPVAGAAITIPPTSWIVFDLVNAPAYGAITVQGRLSFSDTADLELIASRIYVTGDFEIGTAATPFQHKATVTLAGAWTDPVLVVDNSQADSVGNKVLAVFGNASFYGQPIVNTWTTLAATAAVGATSFTVSGSVADWTVGSSIIVSSSEYDSKQREQLTVTAISGQTISFKPALNHSHFAGNVDYSATNNVFFAAKVGLLTRNIVVRGNMTASDLQNAWGAHIVVSEIPSVKSTTNFLPVGKLNFNYVQLDHFGQYVDSPAVLLHYFTGVDNPSTEYSVNYWATHTVGTTQATAVANSITALVGCSFSNGYSQGVIAKGAPNVVLQNNVFDTTYTNAIKMDIAATNAVITGNLIVNALRATTDVADSHHPISAIYVLSLPIVFTNNVVAGAADSALTMYGPSCQAAQSAFSFESHSSPMGVWLLPSPAAGAGCYQVSNVKLWKHSYIGVYTVDQAYPLIVQNAVISDSHEGVHYGGVGNSPNNYVTIRNSVFFGTTPASSCSQSLTCAGVATSTDLLGLSASCNSAFGSGWRHVGIVGSTYSGRGRTCQVDGMASYGANYMFTCDPLNQFVYTCALPLDQRYGLPTSTPYGTMNITNVTFAYWTANECNNTGSGALKSAAISYNPTSETWSPEMWVSQVTWYKSDVDARINMALTPMSTSCLHGCDGWDNFVMHDVDGSLLAGTAGSAAGNVVVTAGSSVVTNNPRCSFNIRWNGYICIQQQWTQAIVYMPNAAQRLNPVYTSTVVTASLNVTGFSVGPFDEACSLMMYSPLVNLLALEGAQTDLTPTGPMPAAAQIVVHSSDPSDRFIFSIFYTQPMQMIAYVNNVQATQLTTRYPAITDPPGTFAFSPQDRRAYVVVSGGYDQTFILQSSGLISVTLGLAVDFATFDGPNVIKYMALLLSIDPSTIKVASVHAGSTIASYYIAGPPSLTTNATLNTAFLTNISNHLVDVVQSGAFTQATGYTVTHMSVTPPSIDGTGNSTVSYTPPSALTSAEAAGIAVGVIAGVIIAVVIVLAFVLCGGVYVVRQRRLAAASKSVYSAKEGVELQQHQDKLADKMKLKRPPPPIVARKESLPSSTFSSSQSHARQLTAPAGSLVQRRIAPRVVRYTQSGRSHRG